ncbi:hypothetical protein ABZX40_07650 [Streptomyces sp. NPDC004610]|uniref:hypothetical protein n=1 Tax=unclassified Streptomyces TaxID=2593676 RepID=UPI0033B3B852
MSGSPKYSSVAVAPSYRRREDQRRREQQAVRRRREQQRAKAREALAAKRARDIAERAREAEQRAREAAERQERARVAEEQRKHALATRRLAEQQAHAARLGQEQAGADTRRLDEVRELIGRIRAAADPAITGELDALERAAQTLRTRIGGPEQLGGPIEELRGRAVLLGARQDDRTRDTDPAAVLTRFETRLTALGPDAARHDPEGRQRCLDLLDRLRAASGPDDRTRFEALLGTVEHALTRHAATATRHVEEEQRAARLAEEQATAQAEQAAAAEAERSARQEARRAAEEAARERAAAEQERRTAALGEAADRLDIVQRPARDAADEARELGDPALAERVEDALRTVTTAVRSAVPDEALAAVTALEELLPEAEAALDELQLAHTRRMDLGEALQSAMVGEGFAFLGGEEHGERVVLRFERPGGASYETTIATDPGGTPLVVYHVDGEPDVTLEPSPEGAVCDRTEDLLARVHDLVGEQDSFVPGELTWEGKPPSRQARPLPGTAAEQWRWT